MIYTESQRSSIIIASALGSVGILFFLGKFMLFFVNHREDEDYEFYEDKFDVIRDVVLVSEKPRKKSSRRKDKKK